MAVPLAFLPFKVKAKPPMIRGTLSDDDLWTMEWEDERGQVHSVATRNESLFGVTEHGFIVNRSCDYWNKT
jgi:hypothetical protein